MSKSEWRKAAVLSVFLVFLGASMIASKETPEQRLQHQVQREQQEIQKTLKQLRDKQAVLHATRAMVESMDESLSNEIRQAEQKVK